MEKITLEFINNFIANNNIEFLATQPKLCVPIINRLCQKMSHGIKFDDIKVCDGLIIDGHHKYLSSLITNFNIRHVSSNKTSATKEIKWRTIVFDENDWDTDSKIIHLNEQDANYNGLDIQFINEISSR